MSDFVEFRHLKYIAAIAETTNISRAAEQLYIAQPPLSRQIRELEEALGLRIFLRKPDGVCMTAAGQMIASYALDAGDAIDAALSAPTKAETVYYWQKVFGSSFPG